MTEMVHSVTLYGSGQLIGDIMSTATVYVVKLWRTGGLIVARIRFLTTGKVLELVLGNVDPLRSPARFRKHALGALLFLEHTGDRHGSRLIYGAVRCCGRRKEDEEVARRM